MIEIKNKNKIEHYLLQSDFLELFSFNIKPYIKVFQYDPHEIILQEGDEPDFLLYLIEGRAKLFLTHENGKISLTNFLSAPCFIGEMELLEAQRYAKGVKTVTGCTCFALPCHSCKEKILQDPKFLRHLCIFLGKKTLENTKKYSQNLAYPLDTRLAEFILATTHEGYYKERHTEVSEYLGVTYRHLLYVLADFVKKGILKKNEKGYHIENEALLKEIAIKK